MGIGYYILSLFMRQFSNYEIKSSEVNQYLLFKKVVLQDIDKGNAVRDSLEADHKVLKIEGDSTLIKYSFEEKFIVRASSDVTDTFRIESRLNELEYVSDSLPIVACFSLNVKLDNSVVNVFFRKNYSSTELIEQELRY
jgi:hypothetical protein